ncbi:hypothetical protein SEA_BUBBABEAR_57 [Microbacterium phage BubbaBear]|uniref:hypothetical protein n=1 Tax=Microbacterium phage BubbaBear TaxID=2572529 RepID=UPI0010C3F0CD|nr:hypothetical protein QDW44_gp57 [Microbacterium phage BubbaBear]QCG77318.1 hypothetical protein SEA_BUBBABEAR_57 [Microbacterium phage BubbaBear]
MTPIEPTPAQIAAFKKAWHKADDAGDIGARTEAGLRAALNPPTEFELLEPGFYVTSNNVTETGVNPGAVLMGNYQTGGWRIETAVAYQHEDNEARIRAWFENVGLTRVELVAYQPAATAEPREVYALDDDDDRWEPMHATDLWHCVAPGCDYLEDLTSEELERRFGPVKYHGLD